MVLFVKLLKFIFEAYIYILLIRLLLQKLGESWNNPVSKFVVKVTEPVIKPLRKFIPGFKGFDLAIIFAAFVINFIEILIIFTIEARMPGIIGSIVMAIGYIGSKFMYIYIVGVILSAVMSWVPALQHNPLASIVNTIARPLMNFASRFIPKVGGIDISPIPLLIVLWLIKYFIFYKIFIYQGLMLAY